MVVQESISVTLHLDPSQIVKMSGTKCGLGQKHCPFEYICDLVSAGYCKLIMIK